MSEKEPTTEEIEPFPLDPLPVEKRDQKPKTEQTKTFELTDPERELIVYSLRQVMNEGETTIDEKAEALLKKIKGE